MSLNPEAKSLYSEVKKLRHLAKDTAIIAVGTRRAIQTINQNYSPDVFKLPWTKRLMFWRRAAGHAPMQFTTAGNLADTLEKVEYSCWQGGYKNMLVLATGSINRITLNVGTGIEKLCIARTSRSRSPLIIDSSSTFANVALQEYHGEVPGGRELICGKNIRLEVDPTGSLAWRFDADSAQGIQGRDFQSLLTEMENSGNSPTGWKNWKFPLSDVIGILSGGFDGCLKIQVTPKGFSLVYENLSISANWTSAFGAALAASGINLAYAGAILLVVYFIPWDSFFQWLGNTLWTLWSWLVDFCSKLVSLAAHFLNIQRENKPRLKSRRIMNT